MSLFLVDKLLEVELELLTFENVSIGATALTGTRGNAGVETTCAELRLKAVRELRSRCSSHGPGGLANRVGLLALLARRYAVMRLEKLAERRSVDLHDRTLGQGVGAHKLVIGRVVHNGDHTGLARNALSAPREVAGVQTQRTKLLVASAHTHGVDALAADFGVCRLAAHLELPLLADLGAHGPGVRALVASVTANTHCSDT